MSSGDKLSLARVYPVAVKLRDALAPVCERIEFAGSLRRAGGDVGAMLGDIELVAIPLPTRLRFGIPAERQASALDALLLDMIDQKAIRRWPVDLAKAAWGPKYKKFWVPVEGHWFQVDLFLGDRNNWGSVLTIRTGPEAFNKAFMTQILASTAYRQQDGYLRVQATGEIVPVADEEDYFACAGVQWVPAEKRLGENDVIPIRRDAHRWHLPVRQDSQQLSLF